jgi:hypothetical protein
VVAVKQAKLLQIKRKEVQNRQVSLRMKAVTEVGYPPNSY